MEKPKTRIVLTLVLIVLLICLMGGTLARFISKAIGNGMVEVAKWHVKVGAIDISSEGEHDVSTELYMELEYDPNITPGKIAPRSIMKSSFTIDPLDTDVGITYTIKLGEFAYSGEVERPNLQIKGITADETELKINKNGEYTGEIPRGHEPVEVKVSAIWYPSEHDNSIGILAESVALPIEIHVQQSPYLWQKPIQLFDITGVHQLMLHVGDFIEYDAGTWTQEEIDSIIAMQDGVVVEANNSLSAPTQAFQFGGFIVGSSRNEGAISLEATYAKMYDNDDSENKVQIAGWRVLDVNEISGEITLISAANPEDYYHPATRHASGYILTGKTSSDTIKENYTPRNWNMYVNTKQGATSAKVLTDFSSWHQKYATLGQIYKEPYKKYQTLIDNHSFYWFAEDIGNGNLRNWDGIRRFNNNKNSQAYGIRILVTLDPNIELALDMNNQRAVTVDGLSYKVNSNGSWITQIYEDTTQTYNIWKIREE